MNLNLVTERLLLRRWNEKDAEDLFRYASDSDVGPITGWPVHQNIQESREVYMSIEKLPKYQLKSWQLP
ncbi:GNAT family N-acetyltransferase, partial [Ileibacterium valens]